MRWPRPAGSSASLRRTQRIPQIDEAHRPVGANRVDEAIERRAGGELRCPMWQMLGIDRGLVRSNRHDIGNAVRREKRVAPRKFRDDGPQLRIRYRQRAAIVAIEGRSFLAQKIQPAIAADQHVRRGGNAEQANSYAVVPAQQRLTAAEAIGERVLERSWKRAGGYTRRPRRHRPVLGVQRDARSRSKRKAAHDDEHDDEDDGEEPVPAGMQCRHFRRDTRWRAGVAIGAHQKRK